MGLNDHKSPPEALVQARGGMSLLASRGRGQSWLCCSATACTILQRSGHGPLERGAGESHQEKDPLAKIKIWPPVLLCSCCFEENIVILCFKKYNSLKRKGFRKGCILRPSQTWLLVKVKGPRSMSGQPITHVSD